MTIDLQPFCAVHDVRSYLRQPFVLDGHTCAGDGHILIRVLGGEAGAEVSIAASVRKLFAAQYADFVSLPKIPKLVRCKGCKGAGKFENADCIDCDGNGEFMHGSHEYECEECNGTGKVAELECGQCQGRGEAFTPVQIGAAYFEARYLRLIAALPNARISVPSATGVAAFVFDGGDGRLMPCRP